jgi:hypothetical protein
MLRAPQLLMLKRFFELDLRARAALIPCRQIAESPRKIHRERLKKSRREILISRRSKLQLFSTQKLKLKAQHELHGSRVGEQPGVIPERVVVSE